MPSKSKLQSIVMSLVRTVEATGGVSQLGEPLGDPEWLDLGAVYLDACLVIGKEPKIVNVPVEEVE